MLYDNEYVIQSLELHLFFARVMKEHAIFLEAGFMQKDTVFSKEADNHKQRFEIILMDAVQVSNGIVSDDILSSEEIITDFTSGAEQKTLDLTGILINQNITKMEAQLHGGNHTKIIPELAGYVKLLNANARTAIASFIAFKEKILYDVLSCNMFTSHYPLFIEHTLREAQHYQYLIRYLDNGYSLEDSDTKEYELFWDRIMMEQALFMRGLLDPTEEAFINTANDFADEYETLLERTKITTDATIKSLTNETIDRTLKYSDFEQTMTEDISACKIRSMILPLFADHALRESNHFLRLLKSVR